MRALQQYPSHGILRPSYRSAKLDLTRRFEDREAIDHRDLDIGGAAYRSCQFQNLSQPTIA